MTSCRFIRPSAPLRRYVRHYWLLRGDTVSPFSQRTWPVGCVQLFFHRGKPLFSQTRGRLQPRHFVCGQEMHYTDLFVDGAIDMLVVVFQPCAARLFLQPPLALFRNESVAVDDLEDPELETLARRIADTESPVHCLEWVEQFLLHRLSQRTCCHLERLEAVVRRIDTTPCLRVDALADTACLSIRQLTRVFAEYVGATPKDFLRIVRVQRALWLFQQHPCDSLAQVAYACGFADESHMIREFKEFLGYTPAALLAACTPVSDYFFRP